MNPVGKIKEIWKPHPGSQVAFMTCPVHECLLHGNRGGGKGLLPEEKVLTPRGWTTMDKLKPGSVISNPDGTSQSVVQVFHRNKQQVYKITFSDGTFIKCDGDHLWFAKIANRIKGKTIRNYMPLDFYGSIHRTEDLYHLLKKYPHKRPLIPCCDPIKYQQNWKSYYDAYLIGLTIGDGSIDKKTIRITSEDQAILDYCVSRGGRQFGSLDNIDRERAPSVHFYLNSELMRSIKELGLYGTKAPTKFIPERFLRGTVEERLAILQGLMDTDGEAHEGKAYFSSVSEQLIDDVRTLVQGLGGWATKTGGGKLKYRQADWEPGVYKETDNNGWGLYIRLPEQKDLFRLERKREKASNYKHGRLVRRMVSIKKLKKKRKTICIVVNNPNRLFVTKEFLVTHNTDVLLMDFLQHVGVGFGTEWRGILFREEYTQLTDVINKSKKWVSQIFPGAKYNGSEHKWSFPDGEQLFLRYMRVPSDYWSYHGHEYPWIGWEELTNWATDECYTMMMSTNRCSDPNVPRKYRATCNPAGVGHGWVKHRFIDQAAPGKIYRDLTTGKARTHIVSRLEENTALLEADPTYKQTILASAQDDPVKYKAWVLGSWDIIAGGFFVDLWDANTHILPSFELPESWNIIRSFDWGSAKPWAVSYIAECNGEQPDCEYDLPYFPKGSAIVIREIYGWNGTVNEGDRATSQEIADRIKEVDMAIEQEYGIRVSSGPADTSIYEVRDGSSIGSNMASHGVHWKRAYKGSGSRIAGWALIRTMLGAAKRGDLEKPHLYFMDRAQHHIRTLPLMQTDPKKPEDINTELEDHAMDSLRYGLTRKFITMKRRKVRI